jgi:hypothetical protein
MPEVKDKIVKKRTLLQKIVNIFLYTGLILFFLLVIIFGVSQTSTFREFLKNTIVEEVNLALNGKLSIEKIDGTIFTSLIIRNTLLTIEEDTLFYAKDIEVKTSPLQLFLKKIYVRKFEISNAHFALKEDSTGNFNISKLIPPAEEDTTAASEFMFTIHLADFRLTNISFLMQDYQHISVTDFYDSFNPGNFKIENLYLTMDAFADINRNNYEVKIDNLLFGTNIKNFELKNFSGKLGVNESEMFADKLKLQTNESDLQLSAAMEYNLFGNEDEDISSANLMVNLEAKQFSFNDLHAFVPATDLLNGSLSTNLAARGSLNELTLNKIEIDYLDTKLRTSGKILNTLNPDLMFITAQFYNTSVTQSDIDKLLPSIGIPIYEEFGEVFFDTLNFEGHSIDFNSNFFVRTAKGNLNAAISMNLRAKPPAYNITFASQNLDISSFTDIQTKLNVRGSVTGKGFTLKELNSSVTLRADGSTINSSRVDTLRINISALENLISYKINTSMDSANIGMNGSFDFTYVDDPLYQFDCLMKNIDIGKFIKDAEFTTNLNLLLTAEGQNLDPDNLNLKVNLNLLNSLIADKKIDSTKIKVEITRGNGVDRNINFTSEAVDINLNGSFKIVNAVNRLAYEAQNLSYLINNKVNEYFPGVEDSTSDISYTYVPDYSLTEIDSSAHLTFNINLKDFYLISQLLGQERLDVGGSISGDVKILPENFSITTDANINHFKYLGREEIFFLSDLQLMFKLNNTFAVNSLEDVSVETALKISRLFSGEDFRNISISAELKNQILRLDFEGKLEEYAEASADALMDLTNPDIQVFLENLFIRFNKFSLSNKQPVFIGYTDNHIEIDDLALYRGDAFLSVNGNLMQTGNQNLIVSLNNFSANDLMNNLLNTEERSELDALINLSAVLTGDFQLPVLDINFQLDDFTFRGNHLGSLKSYLAYRDKNLSADVKFITPAGDSLNPALSIAGSLPVDLALAPVEDRFTDGQNVSLKLTADNFNLSTIGNMLPGINRLSGSFSANLDVTGTTEDYIPSGFVLIQNASFTSQANNLDYNMGIKITASKDTITLDSLLIANSPGTKDGGKMWGSGKAIFDKFNLISSHFILNGELKVLSEASKAVSPALYGGLVISTKGNVELKATEEGAFLRAPILVKSASLTFPPSRGAYESSSRNFVYKFKHYPEADTSSIDFEELISIAQQRSASRGPQAVKPGAFDYSIEIEVRDEATIIFVLSKEFNQNLTAVLKGKFQLERISGRQVAQGELNLLDESTLEFLKTFSAAGTIRFENEIANPYLNITATYKDYYYPLDNSSTNGGTSSGSKEVLVGVKVKLNGPLQELDKSFIREEDNIAVYYGEENIANNVRDPSKDASDAVMFIMLGKFKDNASYQEQDQVASIAGSLLGGFLNTYLGDFVRSVELRKVGSETKFNLSGKVNQFRYTIGGTTDVFQDLSQANVKIEYPLVRNLLIRLERKSALKETGSIQNEMINELGLKYRFEF